MISRKSGTIVSSLPIAVKGSYTNRHDQNSFSSLKGLIQINLQIQDAYVTITWMTSYIVLTYITMHLVVPDTERGQYVMDE